MLKREMYGCVILTSYSLLKLHSLNAGKIYDVKFSVFRSTIVFVGATQTNNVVGESFSQGRIVLAGKNRSRRGAKHRRQPYIDSHQRHYKPNSRINLHFSNASREDIIP